MKNTVLIGIAVLVAVACAKNEKWKYGQGGINARQYVKEQVAGMSADIESIDIIDEDTLLSDVGLMFATTRAANTKRSYYENRITYGEMDRVLDSCLIELMYVENSWRYGETPNDKMHAGQLRKVYTVRVTFKNGDVREPRVLMEQDGITPRMMESDVINSLQSYQITFTH